MPHYDMNLHKVKVLVLPEDEVGSFPYLPLTTAVHWENW